MKMNPLNVKCTQNLACALLLEYVFLLACCLYVGIVCVCVCVSPIFLSVVIVLKLAI